MKPVYDNINLANGAHTAGICELQIIAREWMTNNPLPDFNTGKITTAITLAAGKSWLTFNTTPDSADFTEKPKRNKAGSFYAITVKGSFNYLDATLLQQLETIRHHELVVLVTDTNKTKRLIGNADIGMLIEIGHSNLNSKDGTMEVEMVLEIETATASPYYAP